MGKLKAPTQEDIEIAIDEVVSAIVAYRHEPAEQVRRARARRGDGIRATDAADLLSTDRTILRAVDVTKNPVINGMKKSLTALGKLLHEIVGNSGMIEVAERICDLDHDRWQQRMSPINAAWDGIGDWHA